MNYQAIIDKIEPYKTYSYKELLKLISPQSSTAQYILMDLIASGHIERTINGFRKNQ